jgi:hypothetical protein
VLSNIYTQLTTFPGMTAFEGNRHQGQLRYLRDQRALHASW